MNIIRPIEITPSMVTTNAVDADPQWVSGTTYAKDVKVTKDRRIWISLQASNTGHAPGAAGSEAWWSDAGPSNSWAMFDESVETVTQRANNITVTIAPSSSRTVGLLNLRGKSVHVTSEYDSSTIYDQEQSLWDTSLITDWAEYFFSEPEFKTEAVFSGIPPVVGQSLNISIDATGSTAQCGIAVIGKPVDVGLEKLGLQRSGIDYSQVNFDPYGAVSITKRAYARKVSTQTVIDNTQLDRITRRLDQLASVPVLVLAGSERFGSTVVYGLVSYTVDVAMYANSYVSIEVKGFV